MPRLTALSDLMRLREAAVQQLSRREQGGAGASGSAHGVPRVRVQWAVMTAPAFSGTIPDHYERHLVPVLFEPYARDLVESLRAG